LIQSALDNWKSRLIDTSRRNVLLYYRRSKTMLPITVGPEVLRRLIDGRSVLLRELIPGEALVASDFKEMRRKARENSEEKGLSTLYLAYGSASWPVGDGGRATDSPIVLLPVEFADKGQDPGSSQMSLAGDPIVNPVLLHVLKSEFGFVLQEDSAANGDPELLAQSFKRQAASAVTNMTVQPFSVLGNFSFQKLAIVRDLEDHNKELLANDIVAAIAGDEGARAKLAEEEIDVDLHEIDTIHPDDDYSVIEADSSQQATIAGVLEGQSAVLMGPPGTGKSQTITNLITNIVANGKTILFVAEKRAALEVVMRRLESVGLGHIALDLGRPDLKPRYAMQYIMNALSVIETAALPGYGEDHTKFVDRRVKLNNKDELTHSPRHPAGMSVYEMEGQLLRLPVTVVSSVRFTGPTLEQFTQRVFLTCSDLLREMAEYEASLSTDTGRLWMRVRGQTSVEIEELDRIVRRLHVEVLPELRQLVKLARDTHGITTPTSLPELTTISLVMSDCLEDLKTWNLRIFDQQTVISLIARLKERVNENPLKGVIRTFRGFAHDELLTKLAELRRDQKPPEHDVLQELEAAVVHASSWKTISTQPAPDWNITYASAFRDAAQALFSCWTEVSQRFGQPGWSSLSLKEISATLATLVSDPATPSRLSKLVLMENALKDYGLGGFLMQIREQKVPAAEWVDHLRYVWLHSVLDDVARSEPDLKGFLGSTHDRYVSEFRHLDATRLKIARSRVRRAHAERCTAAKNLYPNQIALIKQEAAKARRHRPLRAMFKDAGEMLLALTPCVMTSPLSVSQLIEARQIFDFVIFDEGSQVLPEDAVASVLRGKYLIVAGDNKQLPPGTFFASQDDSFEEAENEADGYESLLDMMMPFVKTFWLQWHYRSRDEALIAFSNKWIYDGGLVTFPGPGGGIAVRHHLVQPTPPVGDDTDSAGAETSRVVELILTHARRFPGKTLGVITMGQRHANRIQGMLDSRLQAFPELAAYFDVNRPERFFIKSIELVQGDERDCIIISVGYGKDANGNLPLRFGPILSASGHRRLNVAVTRARERMALVSSFTYTDIDPQKVKEGSGLAFLRNFIEYAASNGASLGATSAPPPPMNNFEHDIFESLSKHGLQLTAQVGSSSYRIDMAALHPGDAGRYVLAIECDGSTYHSSYTARDRDRLRQQQLESLGWTFHRIWSTDWFLRKEEEIQRVVEAYGCAIVRSDELKKRMLDELKPPAAAAKPQESQPTQQPSKGGEIRIMEDDARILIPPLPDHDTIAKYRSADLLRLLLWIKGDGKLRSEAELVDAMYEHLPFKRKTENISETLLRVVRRG
jgi:very-short-patch-repair endonuclease